MEEEILFSKQVECTCLGHSSSHAKWGKPSRPPGSQRRCFSSPLPVLSPGLPAFQQSLGRHAAMPQKWEGKSPTGRNREGSMQQQHAMPPVSAMPKE